MLLFETKNVNMATPLRYNMILPNGEPLRFNTPGARFGGTVEEVMAAIAQQNQNMDNTNINTATLTDADIQAVKAAFIAALAKIPFVQNLTTHDRLSLNKLGEERLSFVTNSLAIAKNNATIFPASHDVPNFDSRMALFNTLGDLATQAHQVADEFDDARMKVGSILMQKASDTKKYVDTAAKTTPGLRPASDLLGTLFQKAVETRRAHERAKAAQAAAK